jgi:hypothetical protein
VTKLPRMAIVFNIGVRGLSPALHAQYVEP